MSPLTRPHILVVDDNRDNANILCQYLTVVEGYSVSVAYDGNEAVEVYKDKRPSIVLLDVMMPGRDGWSACKAIKDLAGPEETVRVIMVTALDDLTNHHHLLEAGADDFVEKPFELSYLAAMVKRNVKSLTKSIA